MTDASDDDEWADLWEHHNLLADPVRTLGLVELLARHAPGRSVLEIGCGTGLLACAAARLGARRVTAIEPTERVFDARRLVAENGLSDIVTVLHGRVADLPPAPHELVFHELLNANPFAEGLLEASDAAAAWLAAGGLLAPGRLELHAMLVQNAGVAADRERASEIFATLEHRLDLDLDPLRDTLAQALDKGGCHSWVEPASTSALLWKTDLGRGERPPLENRLRVTGTVDGPAYGAAVWFRARYDAELTLANEPDEPGHWGIWVCSWASPLHVRRGQFVELVARCSEHEVMVLPA